MSLKKKILTDALTSIVIRSTLQVRGLLLIPLLALTLGTDVYGAYIQITVIVALLSNFFAFGLHSSLVNKMQSYETKREQGQLYWTVFSIMFATGVLGSILVFIGAELLSQYTLG
jgi:O-antigen/teichoic acid export membrane protein